MPLVRSGDKPKLLDELLKLYRPRVPRGNFQPDVANHGGNRMLTRVIVTLGLASEEEVAAAFQRLDREQDEATQAAIRRIEAQEAGR